MNNDGPILRNRESDHMIEKNEKSNSKSKWQLLRSALLGGRRDHSSSSSIHRFQALNYVIDYQTLSKEKVSNCKLTLRYRIFSSPATSEEKVQKGDDALSVNLLIEDMQNCQRYHISPPSISNAVSILVQECEHSMRDTIHVDECSVCICVEHCIAVFAFAVSSFIDSCVNASESNRLQLRLLHHAPTESGNAFVFHAYVLPIVTPPRGEQFEFFRYHIPYTDITTSGTTTSMEGCEEVLGKAGAIYTRERRKDSPVPAKALLSNVFDNIDNTGNICVWPAESALLCSLLLSDRYRSLVRGKRVLELGGGQVGLAGLGLAVSGLCSEVVISDGNKECVANQVKQQGSLPESANITSDVIHWASGCGDDDEAGSLASTFDVIIAADCLFFKDFHEDLLKLLSSMLATEGCVLLLQPGRSGTMKLFLDRMEQRGELCLIETDTDYCPVITAHRDALIASPGYDEDLHMPVMLKLKWKNGC